MPSQRSARTSGKALALLAVLAVAATARAAEVLQVEVRDSASGEFLGARVQLSRAGAASESRQLTPDQSQLHLAAGSWQLQIEAPGYQALRSRIDVGADTAHAFQFWLDPEQPARAGPAPSDAGSVRVDGRVLDRRTRQALAGARVRLDGHGAETDIHGNFSLQFELEADLGERGRIGRLQVDTNTGATLSKDLRLVPGAHRLLLDVDGEAHAPAADHHLDGNVVQWLQDEAAIDAPAAPQAPILQPPASLRVGFANAAFSDTCCGDVCKAVAVMSLETYVKRGLNDEWIASWNGHSLRAGAIAYRSYGAWHVANPRTDDYDICSSACCQVNDPDTSASTSAAVDATAGILLERGGSIFRSEYSAENNAWDDPSDGLSCSNADLSCGNGFVGSPAANWPCLADSVASGHGCFGHGRGMSQWGSQRWALNQGQRWPWIVGHYFNASGLGSGLRSAVLSSPLRIDAATPLPASAAPGATLSLQLSLSNLAAQTHPQVFLGASLYRSGVGYLNDPGNDIAVALAPGANAASRPFAIPAGAANGSYDLIVALYLDIDGNAALNSGDLALTLATVPGAVTLSSSPRLFADGFETPP